MELWATAITEDKKQTNVRTHGQGNEVEGRDGEGKASQQASRQARKQRAENKRIRTNA